MINFFYSQKKFCFLSRTLLTLTSSLIFSEKKKEKIPFFDQKQGLTPLEKCDFRDFETVSFNNQERFLIHLQSQ